MVMGRIRMRKRRIIMNDKILVVLAVCFLAGLATYKPDCSELIELFKILSSGLFGLVTGVAIEKASKK